MSKTPRLIFILLLPILPVTAAMALHDNFLNPYPGESITSLSSSEARDLLKHSEFPELSNSWRVVGYQGWYKQKSCLIEQELVALSTPKKTSPGIIRSNAVVLSAHKLIIKEPDCEEKLPATQREDINAAAFSDSARSSDKTAVEVSNLFWIGKNTTDAQLNMARTAIMLSQKCFKSPSNCPVDLKYFDVDGWIHKHVSLIRLNNIHSVDWIVDISGVDNKLNIVFNTGEMNSLLMQVPKTNGPVREIDLNLLVPRSHGP